MEWTVVSEGGTTGGEDGRGEGGEEEGWKEVGRGGNEWGMVKVEWWEGGGRKGDREDKDREGRGRMESNSGMVDPRNELMRGEGQVEEYKVLEDYVNQAKGHETTTPQPSSSQQQQQGSSGSFSRARRHTVGGPGDMHDGLREMSGLAKALMDDLNAPGTPPLVSGLGAAMASATPPSPSSALGAQGYGGHGGNGREGGNMSVTPPLTAPVLSRNTSRSVDRGAAMYGRGGYGQQQGQQHGHNGGGSQQGQGTYIGNTPPKGIGGGGQAGLFTPYGTPPLHPNSMGRSSGLRGGLGWGGRGEEMERDEGVLLNKNDSDECRDSLGENPFRMQSSSGGTSSGGGNTSGETPYEGGGNNTQRASLQQQQGTGGGTASKYQQRQPWDVDVKGGKGGLEFRGGGGGTIEEFRRFKESMAASIG
ncbi:hypothetical protein TrCOL_g12002 [Triparma columacea]|uniref:Uncharacterized protein n=1 Tax=Triparma columacea TaxID=722753 RepID=A0A9W7L7H0_9STRA|nr:hypothetical protein TrCOL_g12002 [Triparma columacea]